MGSKYVVSSLLGTFAIVYAFDHVIADKKIFGGKLFYCYVILSSLQQF